MTTPKAPGPSHRQGITLMELAEMFPDEELALKWFEDRFWPHGRTCGHCGSTNTRAASHAQMPYGCTDGRSYFSLKTGTLLAYTQLPLRKWVYAIYLHVTHRKGIASLQRHRAIGVSQPTAWYLRQRIRQAFDDRDDDHGPFGGPVEVDETYRGGKRKNMSKAERKARAGTGRGTVGKTAVVDRKDRETHQVRAAVVATTDQATRQSFVASPARTAATVYTAAADRGLPLCHRHARVQHATGEYVRETVHTNGMEAFWSLFTRGYIGVYHKMSPKHLGRDGAECRGRHHIRQADTRFQMACVVEGMAGQRPAHAPHLFFILPCSPAVLGSGRVWR